ncbi:MAG: TRAP transporter fused permease subunit [Lachnospiraceae bacterium]|nr:TRAP transporter fused permease subunit [Lachnospiraceae bacterium]
MEDNKKSVVPEETLEKADALTEEAASAAAEAVRAAESAGAEAPEEAGAAAEDFSKDEIDAAIASSTEVKKESYIEEKDEEGVKKRTFDKNKFMKYFVYVYGILMTLFHIYARYIGYVPNFSFYALHWTMGMILVYTLYPMRRHSPKQRPSVIDMIFMAAAILVCIDICKDSTALAMRVSYNKLTTLDYIAAASLAIVSLEAARRAVGIGLPAVAVVFLLYAWKGNIIPGFLGSKGYPIKRILSIMISQEGVFGSSITTSADLLYMMITFGAFLHVSGAGKFFIRFAMSLTGHKRGGPAKVAVISSALFGSVSGSAVSNVIGTGTFTIPLMRKTGYKKEFAGAVEAVASTGGTIMPPVMGTGAFLMAEITGIPYADIIRFALIPALLYFISLFVSIDLEAQRLKLKGVPKEDLENFKAVLKSGWPLLLPLLVLIVTLGFLRWSVIRASAWAIMSCVVASWYNKETRMGPKQILEAMSLGAVRAVSIISSCSVAGIVISTIMLTGLGNKFTYIVTSIAGNSGFLALVLAAAACLVLGMGLPTVCAYLVTASVLTSGLVKLGFTIPAVNMFLFYFSCLSCITPPVCMASFAAANVANASPSKVGFNGVKLALIAFVVPFVFIYDNALMLEGGVLSCIRVALTSFIGVYFFAIAMYGWFGEKKVNPLLRLVTLAGGLLMIIPSTKTDFIGIACLVAFVLLHPPIREKLIGMGKRRGNA